MPLPEPLPGLVISYRYLWHREHRAGRDEGLKDRPCVIVLSVKPAGGDRATVRVVPVTHSRPDDPSVALELPPAVKRHLGLDGERSWVILDEVNEFGWPGFDLWPVLGTRDRFTYGLLPPRLFDLIITRLTNIWAAGQGKAASRD
jgi:hypothetical protein